MTKRVLGRGLDALIPEERPAIRGEQRILQIPLDQISFNPEQPRKAIRADGIAELARSIVEFGVIEPIIVRRGESGYRLVAGERRFRAAREAGLATIPALERASDDEDALVIALVENIQRENLNPVEEAEAYARLRDDFQLTQEEIARRVGKTRTSVANALRLLTLPTSMRDDLVAGVITAGHARAILSVEGDGERRALWQSIKEHALNVRESEAAARTKPARTRGAKSRPASSSSPELRFLEDRLRDSPGTQVEITAGRDGAGKIEVAYYSQADLERLLDLLGVAEG